MRLESYHKKRVDLVDYGRKETRRTAGSRNDGPNQYERLLALGRPSTDRERGIHEEALRHSVVLRLYMLHCITRAADLKIVIKGYTSAWWAIFGHKDTMSRHKNLVKGVVSAQDKHA
jgi:hypothetical protein